MYVDRGFRYLVEIWFAKIAVITAESRESLAAILKIDTYFSLVVFLGELCMPIGLQYTPTPGWLFINVYRTYATTDGVRPTAYLRFTTSVANL